MGADSEIAWTDHTFNPWWGCTKVSPGCDNCYAETLAKRFGTSWGATAERRTFGDKHWREPLKWNAAAEKAGVRARVFCASMADVFEGRPEDQPHRLLLWELIRATPHLDWLLLTKRPGAIVALLRMDAAAFEARGRPFSDDHNMATWISLWLDGHPPANVWLGTTVEDQARARRIDDLVKVPARVRFVSAEPLLQGVDFRGLAGIDWVIVGGESGPGARPFDIAWARDIVRQCKRAGVACFVKQLGAHPINTLPPMSTSTHLAGGSVMRMSHAGGLVDLKGVMKDRKGGDMSEWPADLRVREFPEVRHG